MQNQPKQRSNRRRFILLASALGVVSAYAALLWITVTVPAVAQQRSAGRAGPPVLFSAPLPDMPGMNLTVVELRFQPNPAPPSTPEHHGGGHRHPGSVFVYVTDGTVRLALEGEPVQIVPAGGTFFEPPMAHHVIAENASATEPAQAIAVMLIPDGQPLTIPAEE